MTKKHFLLINILIFITSISTNSQIIDQRNVVHGNIIYQNSYIDQPYMLQLKDGSWFCVFTTGAESESRPGQHIVAIKTKDKGKTWSSPVSIEPNVGPISSWAIPYKTSFGRIYVFYNYNGDNISVLKGKPIKQAGLLGWYCYKYSDDNGDTWSDKNYRIPIRNTSVDIQNDFEGLVQMFWGIDKPHYYAGSVFFSFTKLGKFPQDLGEGWMLKSDNLDTERDPTKINWKLLPDGDLGVRNPKFKSVQEEHNTVILNDGTFYCVFRTALGFLGNTTSKDKGQSWSIPDTLRYASRIPNVIKNPRACPRLFKCKNGNYLLWFHNHGGKDFKQRTPVWVTGGIEKNGSIEWSQPEILLYTHETNVSGMSYPDLIEENGKYWITETQKNIGRIHPIDPKLLDGLWKQRKIRNLIKNGLEFTASNITKSTQFHLPKLVKLSQGGMTIEMLLKFNDLKANQILFDNQDDKNAGIRICTGWNKTLRIEVGDGAKNSYIWTTDEGYFKTNTTHYVSFIVDGLAQTVSVIIDGKLCDGGYNRQYGWGKYPDTLGDINGRSETSVTSLFDGIIYKLNIYNRYLTTSESIGNYRFYTNKKYSNLK